MKHKTEFLFKIATIILSALNSLTLNAQAGPSNEAASARITTLLEEVHQSALGNGRWKHCGGSQAYFMWPPFDPQFLQSNAATSATSMSNSASAADEKLSGYGCIYSGRVVTVNRLFGVGIDAAPAMRLLPFGGFSTASALIGSSDGPHLDAVATSIIAHRGRGSGQNGPGSADYALQIVSTKDHFLSTREDGEFDGGYVITRQGRKGDAGGLLFDTKKILSGTPDDSGGITPIEGEVGWIDPDGTPLSQMHWIPGFAEGAGGLSNGTGYGYFVASTLASPYSALMAIDLNGFSSRSYGFKNAITGCRSPTSLTKDAFCYFRVVAPAGTTGHQQPGDVIQGGTPGQQTTTRTDGAGTWHLRNATDTADLLKVDQAGQTTLADGSALLGETSYRPTVSCGNGAPIPSGGYTSAARYTVVGKQLTLAISISLSNIGRCGSYLIVSNPIAITIGAVLSGSDSYSKHMLQGNVSGPGTIYVTDYAGEFPFINGTTVILSGSMLRQ